MTAVADFLAQNDLFSADLTAHDREVAAPYAEHHAGGLFVLGRRINDRLYVKAHDSWGDDGKIVVHVYDPDAADGGTVDYFDSGHDALVRFLGAEG